MPAEALDRLALERAEALRKIVAGCYSCLRLNAAGWALLRHKGLLRADVKKAIEALGDAIDLSTNHEGIIELRIK